MDTQTEARPLRGDCASAGGYAVTNYRTRMTFPNDVIEERFHPDLASAQRIAFARFAAGALHCTIEQRTNGVWIVVFQS